MQILKIAGITLILIGAASAFATTGCLSMCFDPIKHASTKGFDPKFLDQQEVKQTCIESHADLASVGMKDLAYCDKSLGTL